MRRVISLFRQIENDEYDQPPNLVVADEDAARPDFLGEPEYFVQLMDYLRERNGRERDEVHRGQMVEA